MAVGLPRSAPPAPRRAVASYGRALAAVCAGALLLTGCTGTIGPDDPAVLSKAPAAAPRTPPSPSAGDAAGTASPASPADAGSDVGALVPGFPVDLLPVPDDAAILVTSAVPVGDADVQEVSLNLRTTLTTDTVLATYRTSLTTAGFVEVPPAAPQTDLAAEAVFTRSDGDELIVIGVLDADGSRTVTIGGRVHTPAEPSP